MTATDTNFELRGELVPCGYFRFRCYACGGTTEKYSVRCEVAVPEPLADKAFRFVVCERCLEAGDIDQRLERHADNLEEMAKGLREMIGHLKLPSYAEWEAKWREEEAVRGKP